MTEKKRKQNGVGRPRTVDPTGRTVGVRKVGTWVTDEQHKALQNQADEEGMSVSQLLRKVLTQ